MTPSIAFLNSIEEQISSVTHRMALDHIDRFTADEYDEMSRQVANAVRVHGLIMADSIRQEEWAITTSTEIYVGKRTMVVTIGFDFSVHISMGVRS